MARRKYAPLITEKIEQTFTDLASDNSATQTVTIITAQRNPTGDLQFSPGSILPWVYFEFQFSSETTTSVKTVHWQIIKVPAGLALTSAALYDEAYKKFILKRGMEMLVRDQATLIKRIGVVRIPPRLRRFDEGDTLLFRYIMSSAELTNACGFFIGKVRPA